jgi:hypothetical protein
MADLITTASSAATAPTAQRRQARARLRVEARYSVTDDQRKHLPLDSVVQLDSLPAGMPVPHQGDVVYLSPTSAWGVTMLVHEWLATDHLRVEVWLEHVGPARVACDEGDSAVRH